MEKGFVKNTLFATVGFAILVICNFVFNYFAARNLGAQEYGVFMSYFYLLMAFTQPINSLQLAAAKYVTQQGDPLPDSLRKVTSTLLILGLIALGFFAVLSPLIRNFFHLSSIGVVFIGAGVVVAWAVLAGYRGVYQGHMNFLIYGVNIALEGILRAAIGILFILWGWKTAGAIGSSVVSSVAVIFLLIIPLLGSQRASSGFRLEKGIMREFLGAFAVLLPFGLVMNLDLTLTQNVIGGKVSGYLASCGLIGKNLITLSMVFANVVFSYTLRQENKTVVKGIVLTVLIFGVTAVVFLFAGEWIVRILFGQEYLRLLDFRGDNLSVSKLLPLYIVANIPIGIMQHLVNYSIARNIKGIKISMWIILLILAPAYYLLLDKFPISVFLGIALGVTALADLVLIFLTWRLSGTKNRKNEIAID